MTRLYLFAFLLVISQSQLHCTEATSSKTPTQQPDILMRHADIKSRKFQTHFIDELNALVDTAAGVYLSQLLQELHANKDYVTYVTHIESAFSAKQLMPKIVYLKQLLDLKLNEPPHSVESYYTLRNLNFLGKVKRQLLQLQEESATELRHLRWYTLCGQFWYRESMSNQTHAAAHKATPRPPMTPHYWAGVKLAPLRAETVVVSSASTPLAHIDLERFARLLYANVKAAGAELIDDYLSTMRKLLQEVIEEKHISAMSSAEYVEEKGEPSIAESHTLNASNLSKVLTEIDAILAIDDFYAKRNRLYRYLENDLSTDYEQFKNSQYANEDLAEMLAKLQRKGVDLFVTFIFSNFEFLEHLHETWRKLLPWPTNAHETPLQYDASSQRLFDVHRLYVEFKGDWENSERYDAYQGAVNALYSDTRNGSANMHIFELLNNASANVGSVTLNMIKAKCDEL